MTTRTDLSTSGYDTDPHLVRGDPLTITLATDRDGTGDILVATRPTIDAPFATPTKLTDLSSDPDNENGLQLDAAGRGFFTRNTGNVDSDIFEVARATPTSPISIVRSVDELNDTFHQFDPQPTADGLTLWYASGVIAGTTDIVTATRPDTESPFGGLVRFVHNTVGNDASATLSDDQLLIVWMNDAGASVDLFFAVRDAITDPWGPAQLLAPGIVSTTGEDEFEPGLRGDGCELFFARAPASTHWDIYSVTIGP